MAVGQSSCDAINSSPLRFLNCTHKALPDRQWKGTLKHLTVGCRGFQQIPPAAKLLETTAPLWPRKLPEGTHFLTFVRQPTLTEREQLQQFLQAAAHVCLTSHKLCRRDDGGVGVVAQWVKLPLGKPTSRIRGLGPADDAQAPGFLRST